MRFEQALEQVGSLPVFETGLLLAGNVDPTNVRRQLSRWCRSGQVVQLRRGLYAFAPPYRRVEPHPFLVANRLVGGSYVSTESALGFYGHIPEAVLATTSVTTGRPGERDTPLGRYLFQHIKGDLLWGYERVDLGDGQGAYVARPEKALLDLVYLRPGGDEPGFLDGLRLQHLDRIDQGALRALVERASRPKLRRAQDCIDRLKTAELADYEDVQ